MIAAGSDPDGRGRRARRQGHERDGRHGRGHADHRRLDRRGRAGDALGRHRRGAPGGRQPARPAAWSSSRAAASRRTRRWSPPASTIEAGQSLFPRGIPIGARDRRGPRRGRDLPARAPRAVRRPQVDRHRPGAHAPPARRPDRRGDRCRDPVSGRDPARGAPAAARGGAPALRPQPAAASSAATSTSWCWWWRPWRTTAAPCPGARRASPPASCSTSRSGATMGVSSLVLTAVGYGVGRFRELRDPSHGLLPMPVGAAATGGFVVAFAAVSFMLDVGASVSPLVIRDAIVTVLLNAPAGAAGVHRGPQAAAARARGRPARAPPPPPRRRARPARSACEASRSRPMYLDNERRPTLTPQLAFRVAVIGGVALVMFALIFFRLWYLQVLSGDKYQARPTTTACARSRCRRRAARSWTATGSVLVENRPRFSVKLTPGQAARGDRPSAEEVYRRLAKLLGLNPRRLEKRVEGELKALPFAKPTVKQDVRQRAAGLHPRAPEPVPGRRAGARVPARVPARTGGRAPVRARWARSTRSS